MQRPEQHRRFARPRGTNPSVSSAITKASFPLSGPGRRASVKPCSNPWAPLTYHSVSSPRRYSKRPPFPESVAGVASLSRSPYPYPVKRKLTLPSGWLTGLPGGQTRKSTAARCWRRAKSPASTPPASTLPARRPGASPHPPFACPRRSTLWTATGILLPHCS